MAIPDKFRFSVDRGGTFTDIYAEIPVHPGFMSLKLLSEDPANYPDAPREGIRRVLERVTGRPHAKEGFDASAIEWIRMGTTVATNALLERKGSPLVLVVTEGFEDILRIGYQNRPRIFDLRIDQPELLYNRSIEARERVRLAGKGGATADLGRLVTGTTGEPIEVLTSLDEAKITHDLQQVYDEGIRGIAVVLMHAYTFPHHEQSIGEIAREIGFTQVSLPTRCCPR